MSFTSRLYSLLHEPGGNAESEKDYKLPENPVAFSPDDSGPKNISITLLKDSLVEGEENFLVRFTVTDQDETVSTNNETTNVTIEDSDGE